MRDLEFFSGEEMIKTEKGDCWETPLIHSQVSGQYTFTNKRIFFLGNGVIEKLRVKFDIAYTDIKSIEPYRVVFFNTGIRIYMKSGERYRLSLTKRQQYMDIINTYIN